MFKERGKMLLTLVAFLCIAFTACTSQISEPKIIEDVVQFSGISKDELFSIMGEPISKENWTNRTEKGNCKMTIFSYDKNSNHYEFMVADDVVVRLTIYSNKFWNNEGEKFKISTNKQDICKEFNIKLGENVKKTAETTWTYRLRLVNDKVADFWVQDIDMDTMTYGAVKVTYNLKYFD